MTPSKALFWFCISFIFGILMQSIVKIPHAYVWGILFFGVLTITMSFVADKNIFIILGFCLLFFVIGMVRLQIFEFNIANDKLSKLNDSPEKVTFNGQVIEEPDIRSSYQKLKVKVNDMETIVLVATGRYPEYNYLDEVKISGKLKNPPEFEEFNYKNYLLKEGIISLMDFPKIELVSKKSDYNIFSFFYEKVLFFKKKLNTSINSNFSPPQNFILGGVVFGNDKNWPKDLKDKFNTTGLSHVTAVSGSNIVILISTLVIILLALGLWRQQALYLSIILVWLYIILVGFTASSVRAGIMGSILLFAEALGRQNTSSRTIVLAASLMLLHNPMLLLYDIGFQLSFLASMGIIHLKPLIDYLFATIKSSQLIKALQGWRLFVVEKEAKNNVKKVEELLKKQLKYLVDIIVITLSAQIFTLPIIVYNFGVLSLVSPITNLLVLPIIPPLMVFGFLASTFGIFSGFLGWVFALPCYALIFYLLKVLDIFHQPWAVKNFESVFLSWFFVYYFIVFILVWFLNKKIKPKFLGY